MRRINDGAVQFFHQQVAPALTAEEYRIISQQIESSKTIFDQISAALKSKFAEEELLVMRADDVHAALQRLEWQLERDLGKVREP